MKKVTLILLLYVVCAAALLATADDKKKAGILFGGNEKLMRKVGLQLYSLRNQFKSDVPGTLAKAKQMGFVNVELAGTYGLTPEQFNAELDKAGLRPVSMHAGYEKLRDDLNSVIREAKTFGVQYVGCAWIPHGKTFTEADCDRAIAHFNEWGGKLAKEGLRFFYHIHGYEFQPAANGTLFDKLVTGTKPQHVALEMDVFWVVWPGQDPVKLMKKYPKRVELLHLKELRKGMTGNLSGGAPPEAETALGEGQVNWPAVLREAERQGVKYMFIEDETPQVERQVPMSLQYLRTVRY
ncbi:MAG TPA: sugar phosphate isomerase/epimerase [Blastocatellia bacterium]|nr:sugar phosphate isomerase/epimerase [Blastocatellia bacterium]